MYREKIQLNSFTIDLGRQESSTHNWQRLLIDIPHDKLILPARQARSLTIPTGVQALVIVRQRVQGTTIVHACY
jgi:hypothetical protein